MCDLTLLNVCLNRAPVESGGAIFGFAEFLTALALLVLVFNSSDALYKFRVSVAPIRLIPVTFASTALIGLGALVNDLWFAQRWLAPAWGVSKAEIQAALGVLFLAVVLVWTWFAFVRPPRFGRLNAQAFAGRVYWTLVQGAPGELGVLAAELTRSSRSLVRYALLRLPRRRSRWERTLLAFRIGRRAKRSITSPQSGKKSGSKKVSKLPPSSHAHDTLILIANRKFCVQVVEASPVTAIAIMEEADKQLGGEVLPLSQFLTILTTEAVRSPNSILYQEDGLYTGGVGQLQQYSKAVYGSFRLVEAYGALDLDYRLASSMTPDQYEIYTHIVGVAFRDYVASGSYLGHSMAMSTAFRHLGGVGQLSEVNGREDYWDTSSFRKLRLASDFVRTMMTVLSEHPELRIPPPHRDKRGRGHDVFDLLANLVFELIEHASWVREPEWTAWEVHHNALWSSIFGLHRDDKVEEAVLRRVERLAYGVISEFDKYPHYRSARILGYFLNIYGFRGEMRSGRFEGSPLRRYVMTWTRKNYLNLLRDYPDVARFCLRGSITLDEPARRLVKSFRKTMEGTVPQHFLPLDPPSATKASASPTKVRATRKRTRRTAGPKSSAPKTDVRVG